MWIVAIAWMYVTLMMALAEATSPQGTALGAVITFVFYGLAPLALVMYLLGAPARRKALRAAEAAELARLSQQADDPVDAPSNTPSGPAASVPPGAMSKQADAGSLAAGDAVAPERKEP